MTESEKAKTLEDLYEKIRSDPSYRNVNMGTRFVPGKGSLKDGAIVFIGEAPGRDEEKAQTPFVGAAGRNLNTLLQDIGLSREEAFITNLVKYRPFDASGGNRSPNGSESRYALPYLLQELEILKPRVVVCLGLSSAKALLDDPGLKMGSANGAFFEKHGLKILVTYHPSPYNYKISDKRQALQNAFKRLQEL
jgi:DNA polymerase